MKLEIERKFLLKSLPSIDPIDSVDIDQYYLKNNGIWERVREWTDKSGTKYIHTIKKSVSKSVNLEEEKEISEKSFLEFKDSCFNSKKYSRSIRKVRHLYPDNGLIWEVDVFNDGYKLIIAEIEIPKKTFKLEIPDFIKNKMLLEVTGMKQFSNRSLSLEIPK